MSTIKGKQALITGAASGIGRAIAIRLASEGANLVLIDINEQGLQEVVDQAKELGIEAISFTCDLRCRDSISNTIDQVLQQTGGVDLLINNAGITYHGNTHDMSDTHWDELMQINLHAQVQITRKLLPSLLRRPEPHIVNMASVLGLMGMQRVSAYNTSKFAMVGFSESLRAEYGRVGLGVSVICPGFVKTNLFASALLDDETKQPKTPPKMLCTTPEKVAGAVVKAIRHNRARVMLEPFSRLICGIKTHLPTIYDFLQQLGRNKRSKRRMANVAAENATTEQAEQTATKINAPEEAA